jgi:5-methylcytosine-specific restriction endonuclease McrA
MGNCILCEYQTKGRKKYCVHCEKLRALAFGQNNRAKKLGVEGVIDPDEWVKLCQKYDYRCLRCGNEHFGWGDYHSNLSIDHIIALGVGGENTLDNIQPLCLRCNLCKSYNHDYRDEDPSIKEKRQKYIAGTRLTPRRGPLGKTTLTFCLSGSMYDSMCLYLLDQDIQPTKENIQRITHTWIYEDIEKRLVNSNYMPPIPFVAELEK